MHLDFRDQLWLASRGRWPMSVWSVRVCPELAKGVLGTTSFWVWVCLDETRVWSSSSLLCFVLIVISDERLAGHFVCVRSLTLRVRHHLADSVSQGLGNTPWLGLTCMHYLPFADWVGGRTPSSPHVFMWVNAQLYCLHLFWSGLPGLHYDFDRA